MIRWLIEKLERLEDTCSSLKWTFYTWKTKNLPKYLKTALHEAQAKSNKQHDDIILVLKMLKTKKKPNIKAVIAVLQEHDMQFQLNSLFKEIYGPHIKDLINPYHQPVKLSHEHGVTYGKNSAKRS